MKLSLALHDFYQCWWNPCACAKRQTLSETFCMQVYQWRRQRILIRSRACQREGGTMEKWGWLVVEGVQALFPCEQFTAVPRGAREQWPTLGGGRRSPKRRVKVDICGRARGCSALIIGSSIILHYCTKGSKKSPTGNPTVGYDPNNSVLRVVIFSTLEDFTRKREVQICNYDTSVISRFWRCYVIWWDFIHLITLAFWIVPVVFRSVWYLTRNIAPSSVLLFKIPSGMKMQCENRDKSRDRERQYWLKSQRFRLITLDPQFFWESSISTINKHTQI